MDDDILAAIIVGGMPTLAIVMHGILSLLRDRRMLLRLHDVHLIANEQRMEMALKVDAQGEEIKRLKNVIEALRHLHPPAQH